METLSDIGQSESTTFVLPQELTSLIGRYGKHLSGSDVASTDDHTLESLDFDAETRELLGIDDIQTTLDQISGDAEMDVEEMEQEAAAIKEGEVVDIKDPDAVIKEMDKGNPPSTGDPATDTDTAPADAEDEGTLESADAEPETAEE